jgi:hypothetical protein
MFKIQVIKVYDCSNNDKVYSISIYLSLFDVYFGLLWGVSLYIVATNDTNNNNNNNNKNWRRKYSGHVFLVFLCMNAFGGV